MKRISAKPWIIIALVVLLCAVGLGVAYSLTQKDDSKVGVGGNAAPSTISGDSTSGGNATKNQNQTTSNNSSSQTSIKLEIKDVYQQENGDLVVQSSINGTSSGTCKLVASRGSSVINKSATVLYQQSFSTCTGFTIPINEISSGGTWKISLTLEQDGKGVATTEKEFLIQK